MNDIPEFDADNVLQTSPADLIALLVQHEDRVPRTLFRCLREAREAFLRSMH